MKNYLMQIFLVILCGIAFHMIMTGNFHDTGILMSCGIFGIIKNKKELFDFSTFCTLGIANDTRGGDSCGIFIDGKYEYGADKANKLFQNFMFSSDVLRETVSAQIALGHCRKASVGNISEATAQPVVLCTKDGTVRYVLMHNGTIYNYKELAAKYIPRVNIEGMTDSQVMARIFYYKGYDALEEYQGGAAFAIVDYRQPEPLVLLWRGESKRFAYSKDEEEERPLFVSVDNEVVFSSIPTFLYAQRPFAGVTRLPGNKLMKWTGKKLTPYKSYSRSKVGQYRPVVATTTKYSESYYYFGGRGYSSVEENYAVYDITTRRYKHKGKFLDGKRYISTLGRICDKKEANNELMFFFLGLPFRKESHIDFLTKCLKESKLTEEEFYKKNEAFIRFISLEPVFTRDGVTYTATGINEYKPFTGSIQPIGESWCTEFLEGKFDKRISGKSYKNSLDRFINVEPLKIDLNRKLRKKITCS